MTGSKAIFHITGQTAVIKIEAHCFSTDKYTPCYFAKADIPYRARRVYSPLDPKGLIYFIHIKIRRSCHRLQVNIF